MNRFIKRIFSDRDTALLATMIVVLLSWLTVVIIFPLGELLTRSLHDDYGTWIGFANFQRFFVTPSLSVTLSNTFWVSAVTAVIATSVGFVYAYGLTRTNIPGKGLFRSLSIAPLFAPSMMHGIALIYLFGNKGLFTTGFFGTFPGFELDLYGPLGIVMAEFFYVFPKAVLILSVALSMADMRLFDAAKSLGAGKVRTFFNVVLPGVRFGLMSSLFVSFTLVFTDFGAPKVVGGQFNVLAVDVYKKVIGQQDFSMGAALSLILLVPTLLAFIIDRVVAGKEGSDVSSKAKPYRIAKNKLRDSLFFLFNSTVGIAIVTMLGIVAFAALAKAWPYNLTLTLKQFEFRGVSGGGLQTWFNSMTLSSLSAVIGAVVIFLSAWLIERQKILTPLRKAASVISLFPTAIPGTVIGLAFIFFFNRTEFALFGLTIPNPFHTLYGTIWILVIANVVHFMPVSYLTATTALKKLDSQFEEVAQSLGVSSWKLFFRVTLPTTLPALLEMFSYLFVSSMTTVSAVIFLYAPRLKPASVSVVDMEDAGDTAAAAALSLLIVLANIAVRAIYVALSSSIRKKSEQWKEMAYE